MFEKILDKAILVIISLMLLFTLWYDRQQFLKILTLHQDVLIATMAEAEQRSCQALYFERELAGFYKSKGKIKQ